jgi:hypothetical protein
MYIFPNLFVALTVRIETGLRGAEPFNFENDYLPTLGLFAELVNIFALPTMCFCMRSLFYAIESFLLIRKNTIPKLNEHEMS